jgi:hypothetical protein
MARIDAALVIIFAVPNLWPRRNMDSKSSRKRGMAIQTPWIGVSWDILSKQTNYGNSSHATDAMRMPARHLRGVLVAPAQTTEYGFGDYCLGYVVPMSGYTPPPGVYFLDTFYLYSASATTNGNFPFGNITAAGVRVNFITNIAATAWYTDVKIFGGTLGFGAAVPIGSDTNSAAVSFIGPLGFNRQLNRMDSVVSIGDSAYSASLGWEAGEHHWNVSLMVLPRQDTMLPTVLPC